MKKGIVIFAVIIAMVIIGVVSLFTWVALTDDTAPPELPIESTPGRITVTSNGCCMDVNGLRVMAVNDRGDEIIIAEAPKVTHYDIFDFEMPDTDNAYSDIVVSCVYYYGDYYDFCDKVFSLEDVEKNGLLLYIQEADTAYFNARSGEAQVSYRLHYDVHAWDRLDAPSTLYARD